MGPERQIENYLVRRVKALGGWCLKAETPGTAGCPDRLVMFHDRPVYWVEVKSATGTVSALQRAFHTRLLSYGQPVVIVRSTLDVDTLVAELAP